MSQTPGRFVMHEHHFVSGPRSRAGYGADGQWRETKIRHSHSGGDVPHKHAHTGPAHYGYRARKTTARPNGEQLEVVALMKEESCFELVITDSAIINGDPDNPIGSTPVDVLGFPAADRMTGCFGMTCIVRDERTSAKATGGAE
jgi:hypothetical protein